MNQIPTEAQEQAALMQWLAYAEIRHPELRLLHHIFILWNEVILNTIIVCPMIGKSAMMFRNISSEIMGYTTFCQGWIKMTSFSVARSFTKARIIS